MVAYKIAVGTGFDLGQVTARHDAQAAWTVRCYQRGPRQGSGIERTWTLTEEEEWVPFDRWLATVVLEDGKLTTPSHESLERAGVGHKRS